MNKYTHPFALGFLLISTPAWSEDQIISIRNHIFIPADATVAAGTRVTWINHDADPHAILENDNKFRSPALDTNDNYSRSFTVPGTYKYFCPLHPTMVGSVTVK